MRFISSTKTIASPTPPNGIKCSATNIPTTTFLDDPNSFPRNLTLDEYAVARVQSELGDTSQERTTGVIEGLIARSYLELAIGQDDRSVGFKLLARKVYDNYTKKIGKMKSNLERVGLPPFDDLNRTVLDQLLELATTSSTFCRARRLANPARPAR